MKNIELSPRKESTRNKNIPSVVKFNLDEIHFHYQDSISSINEMFALADELLMSSKETQAKNIWRAQIVFLDSAFDYFMHEITKYGLT